MMSHAANPLRFLRSLVLATFCAFAFRAAAESAFVVSYHAIGAAADQTKDMSSFFISRLNARPGFSLELFSGKKADEWDKPPAAVPPENWISLVQVAFGERDDWLAMVFDGPSGALTYAGRRPAQRRVTEGIFIENIPPGPDQVDRNSVIELAGDFFHDYPASRKARQRPLLCVKLRAMDAVSLRKGEINLLKSGDEMGASMSRPELEGLRALAMAAACLAGWAPTTEQNADTLELEVSKQVLSYTIKARFIASGKKIEVLKEGFPQGELYESLTRFFGGLMPTRKVGVDFASVDMWPVRPVWMENDLLAVEQKETLIGMSMASGERKWLLRSPERVNYRFTARSSQKAPSRLFVFSPKLIPVNMADGKLLGSAQGLAAASFPWGFQVSPAGLFVSASGAKLRLHEKENLRWEQSGAMEWTAGPCVAGDNVFVGSLNGRIAAYRALDGKLLWNADVGERIKGQMSVAGNVVAASSMEGTLFGLSQTDGKLVWKAHLGDLAVDGPYAVKQCFFLASGNKLLWLVDAESGGLLAKQECPEPILSALPLAGIPGFVCSDTQGRITFLKPGDLSVERRVELGVSLTQGLLPLEDMLLQWGAMSEFTPRGPGVIAGDENGFVHLLAADVREDGSNNE